MLTSLHFIAERMIEKAIKEDQLTDLSHWRNKPLPKDDMDQIPSDLRMGYKVLKNSGYVPEEVNILKEIRTTEDLLKHCQDEKEKYQQLKKLECLRFKLETQHGKKFSFNDESPYYSKVVSAIGGGNGNGRKQNE